MGQDIKELGFMLLIIIIVIMGVQWFLLRFTHWSVALIATGVMAFFISSIYVALKHATPNGGSNGPDFAETITPTLIIFGALLVGFWLLLLLMSKQNQIPKMAFIIPLCLIGLILIGRFVSDYIENTSWYFKLFSTTQMEVVNESGRKSNVLEITFSYASNGVSSTIDVRQNDEESNQKEIKLYKEASYSLPRFTDKITFRCVSNATNTFFVQEFPFDYSKCTEIVVPKSGFDNVFFWMEQKSIPAIKIIIKADKKIDFYLGEQLINEYQLNELKAVKPREKSIFI